MLGSQRGLHGGDGVLKSGRLGILKASRKAIERINGSSSIPRGFGNVLVMEINSKNRIGRKKGIPL